MKIIGIILNVGRFCFFPKYLRIAYLERRLHRPMRAGSDSSDRLREINKTHFQSEIFIMYQDRVIKCKMRNRISPLQPVSRNSTAERLPERAAALQRVPRSSEERQ